jgi:hypothetical protein
MTMKQLALMPSLLQGFTSIDSVSFDFLVAWIIRASFLMTGCQALVISPKPKWRGPKDPLSCF